MISRLLGTPFLGWWCVSPRLGAAVALCAGSWVAAGRTQL